MHAVKASIAAVVLALGLVGCGEPDVTGTWKGTGSATVGGTTGNVAMTLTLKEEDDKVTGDGSASGRGGTFRFTISGTAKDDDVSLTATTGSGVGHYEAKLDDDDTMAGTWTEPGVNMGLTLTRQ